MKKTFCISRIQYLWQDSDHDHTCSQMHRLLETYLWSHKANFEVFAKINVKYNSIPYLQSKNVTSLYTLTMFMIVYILAVKPYRCHIKKHQVLIYKPAMWLLNCFSNKFSIFTFLSSVFLKRLIANEKILYLNLSVTFSGFSLSRLKIILCRKEK